MPIDNWFLTADERGNPATAIDRRRGSGEAWTDGNTVTPLIHGATYFARLLAAFAELREGDHVLLTDWRGDHDELLGPTGPTLGAALSDLARRGVQVRGMLWRSHPRFLGFHKEKERELVGKVNDAGGTILLDERVRRGGSHHQKVVLLLHPGRPQVDVGFVGGIDLCHGRRDDEHHQGDPQGEQLDPAYGPHPPWHDIQAEVRGPVLSDLVETFRERWDDPTPLEHKNKVVARITAGGRSEETNPGLLTALGPPPHPAGGTHTVQVLRTYPAKRPGYPFAPDGERSIARIYAKALSRARSFIYVEDQYFWSEEIASLYEDALRRAPELRMIVVVPRHPDRNGAFSGPANRLGQLAMLSRLADAGRDRVAIYDLENQQGTAIYVHAKVVVIDDTFAMIGSDNMNRRSWTHDSEVSIAVLDETRDERAPTDPARLGEGARRFARDLRLQLWREHLDANGDAGLIDTDEGFERWRETAAALDAWHDGGRRGDRPAGRIRPHSPRAVAPWQRIWSWPIYRAVVDPDGRPAELQRTRSF
ncbi:MAG: phospholipase D-like domain-containing protein [Actinomycetota bacterium]